MAKKKKSPGVPSVRRSKEKVRIALRNFDCIMLVYALVVVVSVLVGRSGDYDLGNPNLHGFALCFLLIPAYLILELLSLINFIGGLNWSCAGWEAELLGICDLLLGFGVWLYVRLRGFMRGMSFIRAVQMFAVIVTAWGAFQLTCCGAL